MVDAMHGNPENRAAFESQRAANGEEIFQPDRAFVSPMRMQPVVSHADSEAGGDPIKEDRDPETAPTEHEQRRDCADVKKAHRDRRRPVQTVAAGKAEDFRSSLGS